MIKFEISDIEAISRQADAHVAHHSGVFKDQAWGNSKQQAIDKILGFM